MYIYVYVIYIYIYIYVYIYTCICTGIHEEEQGRHLAAGPTGAHSHHARFPPFGPRLAGSDAISGGVRGARAGDLAEDATGADLRSCRADLRSCQRGVREHIL